MSRTIVARIQSVDWDKYLGPESYNPLELVESLIHLTKYDESNAKNGLDNKVLFAVGNNHAGTYYPAILEAAEFLIEIEKNSEIEPARNCAYAILNNLYYFGPDVGNYSKHTQKEVENFVREKLAPYADET